MNTVAELTEKAAVAYLQSAVFIDDQIFSAPSGKPLQNEAIVLPRPRKPTFAAELTEAGGTPSTTSEAKSEMLSESSKPGEDSDVCGAKEEAPVFHPKEIVGSFARKGIVCALYEPPAEFKTDEDSDIFKLCQAADLVILDWDFHKDDGAKMRDLVSDLVAQSSRIVPHHSRLVIIYTTTPSLQKVGSALFDKLNQTGLKIEPSYDGLRQDVGPTRIVILGKTALNRMESEAKFTVAEKDLASRVIEEFVLKNKGILSSAALIAMGAVKRNSRRILAKFSPDMDGAFLFHRALLLHADDSFENLPALLAEEMQAVIEDRFAKLGDLTSVVADGVANIEIPAPTKKWSQDAGKNERGNAVTRQLNDKEFQIIVRSFLNCGVPGLKDHRSCIEIKQLSEDGRAVTRPPNTNVIRDLQNAVDGAKTKSNERLAALFNSRTFYDQQTRFLTLGTIVRFVNGENAEFSLCIIPLCDSVRLRKDKPVDFPFLRLQPNAFGNQGGSGCVVENAKAETIELIAATKIRNLHIERFTPLGTAGVIEAMKEKEQYWLKASNGKVYEWVGQLKPTHAQRIAHSFGQTLSRVGLSEAEWVRLLCDRANAEQ